MKDKRILAIALTLIMFISIFSYGITSNAKTEYEYKTESGEVTITHCYSRDKIIEIPSEFEGCPVTKIAREAFFFLSNVEKIVVPESVKELEEYAFESNRYLKEIVLPNHELIIEGAPLHGCGLRNFAIPSSWTAIPHAMFSGVFFLQDVTIPEGIKTIGSYAFDMCTYLSNVSIPDGVETIGENAFRGTQIRTMRLPSNLKTIEKGVLYTGAKGVQTLETVAIPKSVTEIKADSGIVKVKEIFFEGTKEDWDKIQKDKATANAELNIIFEKYPSEEEMPKSEPLFTPDPTPVPTPDPLELKLNSPILAFEAETGSLEDQSGRSVFNGTSIEEKKNGFIEFVKDDEINLNVAHLKYAFADYYMYYLPEVCDNMTCEIYFKVKRNNKNDNALIAEIGNRFRLDLEMDSDCVPEDVKKMEIAPTWIRISGTARLNKVGLEVKETIDKWVHITYVRKDGNEIYYVNGRDVTNGGLKTKVNTLSSSYGGFGYGWTYYADDADEYFAYMRVYAGAASPEWVKKMYDNRNTPYDPKNPTVPTIEGETVVGVQEETTKETLMDFVYDSENSDIVTCEGSALAPTALVGTGAKLTSDGEEYSVVVKKDVSGDGKISSIDYLKLKKHFTGNTLSGVYQKAGDSNCDDRITSADYLLIKRYFAAK